MKEKESYSFVDLDIDKLEKFHLAHFNENGKCKKYWLYLNETNIDDLIKSIRKKFKKVGGKQ